MTDIKSGDKSPGGVGAVSDSKTTARPTAEANSAPAILDARNLLDEHEKLAAGQQQQLQVATATTTTDDQDPSLVKRNAKLKKKWNRRMRILFCCLGHKKNKDSIADVASIFAEFYSDLNAPSSDIAAGFVLLSKYQTAQRQWILKNPDQHELAIDQYLSGIAITNETKFLDISTAEDSHLMNDLIYYMNYSLAIFGWPLQVIDDPCMLCCIYPYLRLAPCCGGKNKKRRDDCEKQEKPVKGEKKECKKDKPSKKDKKSGKDKYRKETGTGEQQPVAIVGGNDELSVDKQTDRNLNDAPHCDENNNSGNKCCNGSLKPAASETLGQIQEISRSIPGRLNDDCNMPVILEDNCCGCNSASAERRLAQHNYEIIYISYKSNINVVPFLVAADHSKQTIVVAIRGSMSLSDMVTDMNGTVDPVPIDGCPADWLCHRGITRASMYVKTTLLDEHILERAFQCRPDLGSHNYNLVLCGHSLGAGAAAILGVLMRPLYPSLRAYLYSPPGGILSLPVVEYTKEFAIGIILGNDTVPRLGVAQLERLRYQTLLSLKSTQKSPGKILARALCPSMCCGSNQVDYEPEQSLDLLYGTNGRAFDYNNTKIPFQVQPQVLYVPGRLIHVVKNDSFRSRTQRLWSGPIYQAVWTDNTTYDRVLISEGMFFDHLPNNLMHAMKMLFSRTLPGRLKDATKVSSSATTIERNESSPNRTMLQPPSSTATTTDNCNQVKQLSHDDQAHCQSMDEMSKSPDNDHNNNDQLARVKNVIDYDSNNNNEDMNNNNNNNNEIAINIGSLKGL